MLHLDYSWSLSKRRRDIFCPGLPVASAKVIGEESGYSRVHMNVNAGGVETADEDNSIEWLQTKLGIHVRRYQPKVDSRTLRPIW